MNPLPEIADRLVEHYGERLNGSPALAHDALATTLDSGIVLEIRFASAEQYSLRWVHAGQAFSIDTAPLHANLSTYPNHLHGADGAARSDHLTHPGRSPWDNVRAVVEQLLTDPRLQRLDK